MTPYQTEQLEVLYRQAVLLQVNPAGNQAPCEAGCSRLGINAHHVVFRSQEPGIRWKYEPRFGLWLCFGCHQQSHDKSEEFVQRILAILRLVNRPKATTLSLFIEKHDRLKCPNVTFQWMRQHLRRRTEFLMRNWADAYSCDA